MASTISSSLPQSPLLFRSRIAHRRVSCKALTPKPAPLFRANRRNLLFSLTAITVLTARESASSAQDIPLFGLRKKLEKVEEEAVEIAREAEKGIEAAEKGIETAEKELETAEKEIETAVSYNGFTQAGAVAGVEVVGVLVATAVVNGILGPEGQQS